MEKSMIRLRMSAKDAHYGGNLVDGAHMVHLFGDVATELLIMHDGDEGLFVAYDNVEFLAPVYAGDYIEATGEIVKVGNTSRKMVFEAKKVIASRPDISASAADVLEEPIVVCRASGTCVVKICGAEVTKEQNPAVPYTVEEIVREAKSAVDAGAAIVHLHVREDDGTPTQSKARFKECIDAIYKVCPDVILIPSTGGAVGMTAEERLQPTELFPEMATLDCGTCNFGDEVFENTMPMMRDFGKRMIENNIKPEYECFEMGHLDTVLTMAKKGQVPGAPMQFNFVLGVPGCTPATVPNLCWLVNAIPAGSTWTATGIGRHAFTLAAPAIAMGGNVRVGFEDNLYLERGVLAKSNGELVAKVVRIAKELGRPIATSAEAREILGLKPLK